MIPSPATLVDVLHAEEGEGMEKGPRRVALQSQSAVRQISVTLGFAASYFGLRAISFSHWDVVAGLELAALVLLPYRYWLALAVGEFIPLVSVAITCASSFGWAWATFKAFPSICLIMPVVYGCRERLGLLRSRGPSVNVMVLVACAGLAALVVAGYNIWLLKLAPRPPGYPPLHTWMVRYVLGHFLGILTLTPVAIAVHEAMKGKTLRTLMSQLGDSRLVVDSAGILIPTLGLLIWIGSRAKLDSDVRYMAQVAMFLPLVMLALRHGWQGAAIGGAAASVGIVVLMPARYDHATLQAQALMVFVIPTMLIIGSRISAWHRQDQQEKQDMRNALALAQRNYHEGERQLRRAAYMLREIQTMGSSWMRYPSTMDDYQRTRPWVEATSRFIEYCDPLEGQGRSLPNALQKGSLAQVLADHQVPFRANYHGGVSALPGALHLTLYRMICGGVTHLAAQDHLGEVTINVRCVHYHSQRWIVLRVLGAEDIGGQRSGSRLMALQQLSRHESFQAINDSAATFGGAARQRTRDRWLHLTIVLSG
jgi:two-component system, NarL family, sensor histidine kinase FusK